jgi:hypothetical protein
LRLGGIFSPKKMDRKNVATLQTGCRETKRCEKLAFYLKKALSMLQKMPKTSPF